MLLSSRFAPFVLLSLVIILATGCAQTTDASAPPTASGMPPTAIAQLTPVPPSATQPESLLPSPSPAASATSTLAGSPTPLPTIIHFTIVQTYTVVEGDSWWTLSAKFKVPVEALWAANPNLDPNWLIPGDLVQIPDPASMAQVPTLAPQPTDAQVGPDGGLRLREQPSVTANVVKLLAAFTWLDVVGRTTDNGWLEVKTAEGQQGWVASPYVQVYVTLNAVPVTGEGIAVSLVLTPRPTSAVVTGISGEYSPTVDYRFVYNVTANVRIIYQRGQSYGRKANVFSKIGDSITVSQVFMAPVGINRYSLGAYADLQAVIDYYFYGLARDTANSFTNVSLAAKVGWRARALFSPSSANPEFCTPEETPLMCEYRLVQPSVAIIMLGTNDVPFTPLHEYEQDMRKIIEYTLEQGIVPVVSTIPPFYRDGAESEAKAEAMNQILADLTTEYDIPLLDYWGALQGLPEQGMGSDGVHPSWAPVGHSADFTPTYLQYGMVVRNITALYALDAVWRTATQP